VKNLFNKNFYRFALGFIGILLCSFMVAAVVSYVDNADAVRATAEQASK